MTPSSYGKPDIWKNQLSAFQTEMRSVWVILSSDFRSLKPMGRTACCPQTSVINRNINRGPGVSGPCADQLVVSCVIQQLLCYDTLFES